MLSQTKQTKAPKVRADKLLVDHGHFTSRTQARISILAGRVRVGNDTVIAKSSERWDPETVFTIKEPVPYVSRGALKLIPALDKYLPHLESAIALDLGASTGGFTDVLLQRGAIKVYAVDVGYGQLHHRLRTDPRVICLEKVNARYLSYEHVPEAVNVLTADLSFISLTKVLPTAVKFLKPNSWIFLLIKPQFEASPCEVNKGGVVKSTEVINRIIRTICDHAENRIGWKVLEVMPSPIKGPKGNQEHVCICRMDGLN